MQRTHAPVNSQAICRPASSFMTFPNICIIDGFNQMRDTLLQLKLQESNSRLYHDVSQTVRQVYSVATREVRSATAQLNTSQSAIINASHSIRLILDDLKAVSEKIDIITSCQILPDINISNPKDYTAPVP
ncbi:hypothetical protein F2P81_017246 [Scophthalmus maximus]|uniref:Biogenesis of lysosome-related organelles complex 1 subunit 3 n=1 Tax=Scophthalmus maximus TaxID=52904 RepID=A0A6A4SDF1_SCOMX|nr:hypothetical protein F2P81_017246 [Scophthalmus maximus]